MLLSIKCTHVPAAREVDADINEWGMLGIKTRAAFGEAACEVGDPDHESSDTTTSAVDTVANILHHVAYVTGDVAAALSILETARMHFEAERSDA